MTTAPPADPPTSKPVGAPCYNPSVFRPDNKPLLDVRQWREIQLFLVTASQLPLTADSYPEPRALPIFNTIHAAAGTFQSAVLPRTVALGQAIWDFGQASMDTFSSIVELMQQQGGPDKGDIAELYHELISIASEQEAEVAEMVAGTVTFSQALEQVEVPLEALVATITAELGPLQDQVTKLTLDVKTQNEIITVAQRAILDDQRVIHDTRYYAWIPIIGAIVAAAEIGTHSQDIRDQVSRIDAASAVVKSDTAALNALHETIEHLTMAQTLLTNLGTVLGEVLPAVKAISGAWNGIGGELSEVVKNIENSEASELANMKCLAQVRLTTAVNEFEIVRNDAHDFNLNFQMEPAPDHGSA